MKRSCLILCFLTQSWAAEFYVSPNGQDDQPDSEKKPFASLEMARDRIRELRKKTPTEPVTVWLEPGVYQRQKTFELGSSDTITTYRSRQPGKAVLNAAIAVPESAWSRVPADDVRLDPLARGKVYQLSLEGLGIKSARAFLTASMMVGHLRPLLCR